MLGSSQDTIDAADVAPRGLQAGNFSYKPAPFEEIYYEDLFLTAAESVLSSSNKPPTSVYNNDEIPAREAAHFLAKSTLPVETLREVWTMAKPPNKIDNKRGNSMNREEFNVAVRLIQLHQNKQKAKDNTLIVLEDNSFQMQPPLFTGVSGSIVPFPVLKSKDNTLYCETGSDTIPAIYSNLSIDATLSSDTRPSSPNYSTVFDSNGNSPNISITPLPPSTEDEDDSQKNLAMASTPITRHFSKPIHRSFSSLRDSYSISPEDQTLYSQVFDKHRVIDTISARRNENDTDSEDDEDDNRSQSTSTTNHQAGYIYVTEALQILSKSGLDQATIGTLWDLVASDPDAGRLDRVEFLVVMHLVKCVTTWDFRVPETLPESLRSWMTMKRFGHNSAATVEAPPTIGNRNEALKEALVSKTVDLAIMDRTDRVQTCALCTEAMERTKELGLEMKKMQTEMESMRTLISRLSDDVTILHSAATDTAESKAAELEAIKREELQQREEHGKAMKEAELTVAGLREAEITGSQLIKEILAAEARVKDINAAAELCQSEISAATSIMEEMNIAARLRDEELKAREARIEEANAAAAELRNTEMKAIEARIAEINAAAAARAAEIIEAAKVEALYLKKEEEISSAARTKAHAKNKALETGGMDRRAIEAKEGAKNKAKGVSMDAYGRGQISESVEIAELEPPKSRANGRTSFEIKGAEVSIDQATKKDAGTLLKSKNSVKDARSLAVAVLDAAHMEVEKLKAAESSRKPIVAAMKSAEVKETERKTAERISADLKTAALKAKFALEAKEDEDLSSYVKKAPWRRHDPSASQSESSAILSAEFDSFEDDPLSYHVLNLPHDTGKSPSYIISSLACSNVDEGINPDANHSASHHLRQSTSPLLLDTALVSNFNGSHREGSTNPSSNYWSHANIQSADSRSTAPLKNTGICFDEDNSYRNNQRESDILRIASTDSTSSNELMPGEKAAHGRSANAVILPSRNLDANLRSLDYTREDIKSELFCVAEETPSRKAASYEVTGRGSIPQQFQQDHRSNGSGLSGSQITKNTTSSASSKKQQNSTFRDGTMYREWESTVDYDKRSGVSPPPKALSSQVDRRLAPNEQSAMGLMRSSESRRNVGIRSNFLRKSRRSTDNPS